MSVRHHLLHGMRWATEIDLHLPPVAPDAAVAPDLVLSGTEVREVPEEPGAGAVLAHLSEPSGRPLYTFTAREDGGVLLRFHRLCEIEVDHSLSRARCWLAPGVDAGYVPVLATGMLATVVLVLRGHPVLHGSAVEDGGSALAFVGASGMGKSTLSSLLCRDGAALVTDDVLRLDPGAAGYVCRSGGVESRLRRSASPHVLEAADGRSTADGRTAVAPARLSDDHVPLRVIAVPYPSREVEDVEVTWLAPATALVELLRFPRIVGWQDPATVAQHFTFLGDVVRTVPVARVRVPWQTRFDDRLAGQVTAGLADPPVPGSAGAT